jgi:hypothetical protein
MYSLDGGLDFHQRAWGERFVLDLESSPSHCRPTVDLVPSEVSALGRDPAVTVLDPNPQIMQSTNWSTVSNAPPVRYS